MDKQLWIYNSLTRRKEIFEPLNPPFVGLYVCGPTVYGDPHLGHARPAVVFDLLFRYLQHLGYRVRYVRNITDVGHLENDADHGEDKIAKKARLEQIEPMEVVQYYTNRYRQYMDRLRVLKPSIEPTASGHVIEQQQMIDELLQSGFAYQSQGSVYFDVERYNKQHHYGVLSGRNIEDMLSNTRSLAGQDEKRSPLDFALWKKAAPEHIMRWPSKWSDGFPGWHLECSVMSRKYLGEEFDIHGGGMDLRFPHHECEIAQSTAAQGKPAVRYWMHNNMITINGQKMGKSLGNYITLEELFAGNHALLEQAYSPMTIRFFMLQAHYSSTLDFSNEALQAAQKGYERLMAAKQKIGKLKVSVPESHLFQGLEERCYAALNDDLNSPILIAHLFEAVKLINQIADGKEAIGTQELENLNRVFNHFVGDVLGLEDEQDAGNTHANASDALVTMLLELRQEAKARKDWASSDQIRNQLKNLGVVVKDTKDGFEWNWE